MNLRKILAQEMANGEGKAQFVYGEMIGYLRPEVEWLKWLSYIPEFQQQKYMALEKKLVSEVSFEELEFIRECRFMRRMASLFQLYKDGNVNAKEYSEVYDFMASHSLDELMLFKLSSLELEIAKERIKYYSQVSSCELEKFVKERQKEEVYSNLNMIDAYLLHVVSRINFKRGLIKLNEEINAQIKANENMRFRSLHR